MQIYWHLNKSNYLKTLGGAINITKWRLYRRSDNSFLNYVHKTPNIRIKLFVNFLALEARLGFGQTRLIYTGVHITTSRAQTSDDIYPAYDFPGMLTVFAEIFLTQNIWNKLQSLKSKPIHGKIHRGIFYSKNPHNLDFNTSSNSEFILYIINKN